MSRRSAGSKERNEFGFDLMLIRKRANLSFRGQDGEAANGHAAKETQVHLPIRFYGDGDRGTELPPVVNDDQVTRDESFGFDDQRKEGEERNQLEDCTPASQAGRHCRPHLRKESQSPGRARLAELTAWKASVATVFQPTRDLYWKCHAHKAYCCWCPSHGHPCLDGLICAAAWRMERASNVFGPTGHDGIGGRDRLDVRARISEAREEPGWRHI